MKFWTEIVDEKYLAIFMQREDGETRNVVTYYDKDADNSDYFRTNLSPSFEALMRALYPEPDMLAKIQRKLAKNKQEYLALMSIQRGLLNEIS